MSDGGEPVKLNLNGNYAVEQMYVQYFLAQHSNKKGPLVFWHGGAMTGAVWETTPDGRDGWVNYFLREGWDVYVCDAVERGRSGFAPYPQVWPEGPVIQTVDDVYTRFRIGRDLSDGTGPSQYEPFPNTRFPINYFEQFCLQMVPRWTHTNEAMLKAFHELLKRIGPAIMVCHSQSGPLTLTLARQAGPLVRAVVAIEPAGIPTEVGAFNTPTLIVLGGNIEQDRRWTVLNKKIQTFAERHSCVDVLRLTALGIEGNSHVLMMDNNSDDIARRVDAWLGAR